MASRPRITVHDYLTPPSDRSRGGDATYSVGILNLTRDEVALVRSFAMTLENGRERPALRGAEIDRAWSEGIANMSDEERRVAARMAMSAREPLSGISAEEASRRRREAAEMATAARLSSNVVSAPNTTAGSSGSIKTRYLQGEWGPRPAEFYEEMARDAAKQEEPEEERNRFSGLDLD
jgi:hypothetical protein